MSSYGQKRSPTTSRHSGQTNIAISHAAGRGADGRREPGDSSETDELGRRVGLSRSALHERFAEMIGQPPMQYLTNWRMQVAGALLRNTNATVTSVAQEVGYDSEAAFARAFKRLHVLVHPATVPHYFRISNRLLIACRSYGADLAKRNQASSASVPKDAAHASPRRVRFNEDRPQWGLVHGGCHGVQPPTGSGDGVPGSLTAMPTFCWQALFSLGLCVALHCATWSLVGLPRSSAALLLDELRLMDAADTDSDNIAASSAGIRRFTLGLPCAPRCCFGEVPREEHVANVELE